MIEVELIDSMGSDLSVVNAARVSFDNVSDWEDSTTKTLSERDRKLIHYLAKNKHTSCFEHQSATLRITVPIPIARQIQRHRTFCLSGDSMISFQRPDNGAHYPYRLDRLYKNWNDPAQKVRIKNMAIRSVDESTGEIITNKVVDVMYSGKKLVYVMLLSNGMEVKGSKDHRIFTRDGWRTIGQLREEPVPVVAANYHKCDVLASEWPKSINSVEWRPVVGWEGRYEVSNAGEIRSLINTRGNKLEEPLVKTRTKNTAGYACVSLSRGGVSRMYNCHTLVMEAFVGPRPDDMEVRHLDGNRLNSDISNLAYGYPWENQADRNYHGTVKYKGTDLYDILEIVAYDVVDTYDISVEGPNHNFFANGVVVHNSYNEVSRRYVDSEPEFFMPKEWRARADNVKQGSSDEKVEWVNDTNDCLHEINEYVTHHYDLMLELYNELLDNKVAPELARMVLPQAMMTQFYMTGNLRAWNHFLKLRLDAHSQLEVREMAGMVATILEELFPESMKALMTYD